MFFIREMKYLYYYEKSRKKAAAGTLKCQMRDREITLNFCLKRIQAVYPLHVKLKLVLGNADACNGTGLTWENEMTLEAQKSDYKVVMECKDEISENPVIYCFLELGNHQVICDEKTLFEYVTKTPQSGPASDTKPMLYSAEAENSVVHIAERDGEKEEYYVIAPEKLKLFGETYEAFADNSFLLHGYYNYRHVLVGPVKEGAETDMRIGVPGNYHKKEEIVANMFGFLSFIPVKGEKETGAFGYYFTHPESPQS